MLNKEQVLEEIVIKLSQAKLHKSMGEQIWGKSGGTTFTTEIAFLESIRELLEKL